MELKYNNLKGEIVLVGKQNPSKFHYLKNINITLKMNPINCSFAKMLRLLKKQDC